MVDDFMVCVDRIIASACYEPPQTQPNHHHHHHHHHQHQQQRQQQQQQNGSAANVVGVVLVKEQERNQIQNVVFVNKGNDNNGKINDGEEGCSGSAVLSCKKIGEMVVECRICQEEDQVQAMEAPCACNGTLKFAHRKCIQKWCNKKGDITCEICNQVFSPNYSLPPARSNPDVLAIDIRQAWGPHIDLRDSHLLALAAAERQFLQAEYEDYAVASTSSIACLRSVALILLMVWLIRQVLMATRDSGMVQDSSAFFNFQVSLLQFAGVFLPCYVMARSWYIMQSRRRRQGLFGH